MSEFFAYQGNMNIKGSRDAIREAFNTGLIEDGETWMETIRSRQSTVHIYNEETAEKIVEKIIDDYTPVFRTFRSKMESLRSGNQGDMFQIE